MSFERHFGIVSFALLLSQPLYPCSIVMIGGFTRSDGRLEQSSAAAESP
jgi:hypothetical protein